PHLPAGILSPYSDGERDAGIDGFANHQPLQGKDGAGVAASPFSPSLYGGRGVVRAADEKPTAWLFEQRTPGRAMRGGADLGD
ncbi:hypothetical protein EN749_30410, partial [Mesorhizobium sp. M7A.F.Ca.ET.027.02.1.1]